MKPLARRDELTIEEIRGETLVYDLRNHKAHCLNQTAAAVWQCCDGNTTVEEIAAKVGCKLDAAADEDIVRAAIALLAKARLLDSPDGEFPTLAGRPTRRQIAAGAALMVPVVASILVPTAAAARSGHDRHWHLPDPDRGGGDAVRR